MTNETDARSARINLASGGSIDVFNPQPAEIDVGDIAHALAMKVRWNGHVHRFYSVAQHSVLVARALTADAHRLWGLLHDAAEAYLPDVPSPIKKYCPEIVEAERRILRVVADVFRLPVVMPAAVHLADMRVRSTEARDLVGLNISRSPWVEYPALPDGIVPMSPDAAERLFLHTFRRLTQERDAQGMEAAR